MMRTYHCWSPVRDEDEGTALKVQSRDPQHAATQYAQDFHYRRDGWEHQDWPILVLVRDITGPGDVDEIEVDREVVPEFTARRRKANK